MGHNFVFLENMVNYVNPVSYHWKERVFSFPTTSRIAIGYTFEQIYGTEVTTKCARIQHFER